MHELTQYLIDNIGRNSQRFGRAPPEASPVFRQEGCCRHLPARAISRAIRLEYPLQRTVKLVFGIYSGVESRNSFAIRLGFIAGSMSRRSRIHVSTAHSFA